MKTILRLLDFLKPFRGEVALSILIGVATIGAGIGMLGTSAYLISAAALHPSIADLQVAIVGVRFFGISRGVFRYLERVVSHSVNLKVLGSLRVWFYEQAEKIAPAGLQAERGGDLLNRVMADMETLENFYVRVVSPFLAGVIVTVGMSLFLGSYFYELGIILAVGMITNGLLLPSVAILLTRKTGEQLQRSRAALSADMIETFQGLEDLQAAGAANRWVSKIEVDSKKIGQLQNYYGFLSGLNSGLTLLVLNATLLIILITAIPLVSRGQLTGVSLAVVSFLTMASFEATNPLPQAARELTASIASAETLFRLTKTDRIPEEMGQELSDSQIEKTREIKIEHLTFAYSDLEVLHDISFSLQKGKWTALVGPSGAGKSSLVNLLLRFWEFTSGDILLDGVNIKNYSPESIRCLFGVISQADFIFAATLRQNLLLANPSAKDPELIQALDQVELSEWFNRLPEGLDTWAGEHGSRLSGGEKQRLAAARVLLKGSPFLLLDEPTAQLDRINEKLLLETFFNLFHAKGVLLITHRLEMMQRMDEILFLQNGKIVERGNHLQLVANNGPYARFWRMQHNEIQSNSVKK